MSSDRSPKPRIFTRTYPFVGTTTTNMRFINSLIVAMAVAVSAGGNGPYLNVTHCPTVATVSYANTIPSTDNSTFPKTEVSLCYDTYFIYINFTALEEERFYYNDSIPTNGPIYEYEVMGALIYRGTNVPQTYLEFEVAPNNVTFSSFIFNPSKALAVDRFYISNLANDKLTATTSMDPAEQKWESQVQIPLGLFNIDEGYYSAKEDPAKGSQWRMNFFRTFTSNATFPKLQYGGWSAPYKKDFHIATYFGKINFI